MVTVVDIALLVLQLVTLAAILSYARVVNKKFHSANKTAVAVEQGVYNRIQELAAAVTHNILKATDEVSVSIADTERTLEDRFSRVVPELEEFVQHQRMAHISPLCHYDYLVPTALLKMVMDTNRMSVIIQEREYLKDLEVDILHNGLREPLIVAYDNRGQMLLHEGHHRLRVMDGFPFLPVKLKKVPKSAGTFNPVNVERLFSTFKKENYVKT